MKKGYLNAVQILFSTLMQSISLFVNSINVPIIVTSGAPIS